jgi:uncharacterized protein involved in exopolysaccharide biosynthesis
VAELREVDKDGAFSGDVLTTILGKWRVIFGCAVIGGLAAYAGSRTLLPEVYESQGTVFVQQSSPMASMLRELPVSLVGKSSDSSGYLITVLQSDTMVRRISQQLDLYSNKDFNDGGLSKELAEKKLKRGLTIRQDKNGAVTVAIRTQSPELCAKIINHMLDNLSELYVSESQRRSMFVDKKLAETSKRLGAAEDAMVAFQNTHNLAMIDEQTKSVVLALGELDSQLMTQKVELEQVQVELANGGDLEELVRLRVRKKVLESSIGVINRKIDSVRKTLDTVPTVAIQYARLRRKVAIFTKAMEILTEQAGMAAITQHGEDGDYRVVDWAQVKREPVGPRNVVNAAIGAALVAFVGMAAIAARRPASKKKRSAEPRSPEERGAQI